MDDHVFCFIICVTSELFLQECLLYISNLHVPDGYSVDILTVTDAVSMTSGYNEAMNASNAKYKIYMHQDVFILNEYFLINILKIFDSDKKIGMIGMVGAVNINKEAIMWGSSRVGNIINKSSIHKPYIFEKFDNPDSLTKVSVIDGFLMVTCIDIPWREDIFDGWHFYDLSQSMEFRKQNYDIVVPEQTHAWCLHDDRVALSLFDYNHYRKLFINEYKSFLE